MLRSASFLVVLSAVFLVMACGTESAGKSGGSSGSHAKKGHWGYAGEAGPQHWGTLSPDYAACADGTKQSPIDIAGPSEGEVPTLATEYTPSKVTILNNGHSIQVNYDAGSALVVDGERYDLLQFHFHSPSEHTVDGNSYAMEMHLVHRNAAKGELAVLGVLIERGEENKALASVWANLPLTKAAPKTIEGATVNILDALPADRSIYTYAGSLTTPPCTEGVHWFLLTTPITMSGEQIAAFQKAFRGNARPVQPLHGRVVTTD